MPINNCPFTFHFTTNRPVLDIEIINPQTGKVCKTKGIIDTGADECAIPAYIAKLLGYKLEDGATTVSMTGNGPALPRINVPVVKLV